MHFSKLVKNGRKTGVQKRKELRQLRELQNRKFRETNERRTRREWKLTKGKVKRQQRDSSLFIK